jgi:lipopolysaccharide assembly outer membrane protein LptD (OstA)
VIPRKIKTAILQSVLSISLVLFQAGAIADDEEDPGLACPGPSLAPMIENPPDRSHAPISVVTRQFDARKVGMAEARDEVELRRADQLLTTELLLYDPQQEIITMPGKVYYTDSVMHISGTSAEYNFLDESGQFSDVDYGLMGSSAKGTATHVTIDSGNHSVMHGLKFTTCPGESPEWLLSAKELELDFEKGMGTVKGAKLKFFDIPFIYLPYMTFPIDDRRKSGFLYPFISTANDNGFEFSIPYYWNIAPDQDATITPVYFTERGFMLTGEYRFLTPRSMGTVNFDYMPDDEKNDDARYHYRFAHDASLSRRWSTQVIVDRVSDDQYFQDFSTSLASASRQYLRSKVGLYGGGHYWKLSMIADDFQVVDEAVEQFNEPYRRLPRIAFDLDRPLGYEGLRFLNGISKPTGVICDQAPATGTRLTTLNGMVYPAILHPTVAWKSSVLTPGYFWSVIAAKARYEHLSHACFTCMSRTRTRRICPISILHHSLSDSASCFISIALPVQTASLTRTS